MDNQQRLLKKATNFIKECNAELLKTPEEIETRLVEVKAAIMENGYYEHTAEELEHGAKMAWRNSNRCIGRLFWNTMQVVDARTAETEDEIAALLFRHIEQATNEGRIRPTITICKQDLHADQKVRILNQQLIRYAGYQTENGIIGDSDSLRITELCQSLGWQSQKSDYDVLPLLIQIGDRTPRYYELPADIVLEVPLTHPELPAFADLGLQWYAVPIVSNMRLEMGGISYSAAPFNGWYMGTEIGARNLADTGRYNKLPAVAEIMGLDTTKASTLWKDRALVELNIAVLHSYKQQGIAIVDHHTAAQQFMSFEANEAKAGREVTGNWAWLIPPMSPAATPIFHKPYKNEVKTPNFFYHK
ncbi:nitric oxide synthase [Paenibacillus albiflavus]|uniref:Nitric oxide synthase oxygenase n=1 Tax=Paenibacillus albiflavus TaxID=2545760 RepID=A0A4R4EF90_9BACL|nr:nitric oxide synthase oxygenase [Paenibacillus albiflavus]TCZ78726.1 nitric oxide synthase [Paenibacillus albiflavus]